MASTAKASRTRDYTVRRAPPCSKPIPPGVLHTGSLLLVPPEDTKGRGDPARRQGFALDHQRRCELRPECDLAAYVEAVKQVAKLGDWIRAMTKTWSCSVCMP